MRNAENNAEKTTATINDRVDLVIAYKEATAAAAYHQGLADGHAMNRHIAVAKLAATGLSLQEVADNLGLGTKARAQQLVDKGKAALTNPGAEMAKNHPAISAE